MQGLINWIKQNPILFIAYICVGIGLLIWGVFLFLIDKTYNISGSLTPEEMAQTGQVGDFIGGVIGSVWALAGVFLYFSALKLQQQELKSQREEMATSQKLLDQQLFETTFFNLLKVQDNIKNNIKAYFYSASIVGYHIKKDSYEIKGSDFFNRGINELDRIYSFVSQHTFTKTSIESINGEIKNYYRRNYNDTLGCFVDEDKWGEFKQWVFYQYRGFIYYVNENTFKNVHESKNERRICAYSYWLFYYKYEHCLGHYCRHFYNIIKYLDDYKKSLLSQIDINSFKYADEKRWVENKINNYFAFAQSGLSSSELVILFYNMLLFPNAERLYSKYNIFENMHIESLINAEHSTFFPNIEIKSVERFRDMIWRPETES